MEDILVTITTTNMSLAPKNSNQIMKPGEMYNMAKKKQMKKNWIASAIKKPGSLHKEMGVPTGKKIPLKKLAAAAKKGGVEGKRARLAQTLKSFHKTKMTQKHGLKEGSKADMKQDKTSGIKDKKVAMKKMCKTHSKTMCKKCS